MRACFFRIGFGLIFALAAVLALTPMVYARLEPWTPVPINNPLDVWEPSDNPDWFMLFRPGTAMGMDMALDHISVAFERYTLSGLRAAFDVYCLERFGSVAEIYCEESNPFLDHISNCESWPHTTCAEFCVTRLWDRYSRDALHDLYTAFTVEPGDGDLGDLLSQFPEVDLDRTLRRAPLSEITTPVFEVPIREGLDYADIYALLKDMRATPGILMAEPGIYNPYPMGMGCSITTSFFYVQTKTDLDPVPQLNEEYGVRTVKTYEEGDFFYEVADNVRTYLLQTTRSSTVRAASLAMYYYQDAPESIVFGMNLFGGCPYSGDIYTLVGSEGEAWNPDPFELEPEGEAEPEGLLPEEGEPAAEGDPVIEGESLPEGEPAPEGLLPDGEPIPEGPLPEGVQPDGEILPEGAPLEGNAEGEILPEGEATEEGQLAVEGESLAEGQIEPGEGEISPTPDGELSQEGEITDIPSDTSNDEGQPATSQDVNLRVPGCFG